MYREIIAEDLEIPADRKAVLCQSDSFPANELIKELMPVKPERGGIIVGSQGSTITALGEKFKCHIAMGKWRETRKDPDTDVNRIIEGVMIEGKRKNVQDAKLKIKQMLDSAPE